MTPVPKLVIGASGFLGSHVVKELVAQGYSVRTLVRETSNTTALDGLSIDIRFGEIFDAGSVRSAMAGCDVVYYCVVDARPWLRDSTPMWRTNVEGLRTVLDVAAAAELRRFVFTSSVATIGIPQGRNATEEDANNWADRGGDYVRTRVAAENLVMRYCTERGLPGVAMCVANTYGPGDLQPTPHGGLVWATIRGKMTFYVQGVGAEVVGIDDAARALILAGDRGKVGERYIVAERFMTSPQINEYACAAVGVTPPTRAIPLWLMSILGGLSGGVARIRGTETQLTRESVRLMHIMGRMDHGKAVRELGWDPSPTPDAIAAGARDFASRRR